MKNFYIFALLLFSQTSIQAQKIACGSAHTLVICKDSTVWACGLNDFGQLGNGTFDSSNIFVKVGGIEKVVAVSCGMYFSYAIKNDGTVWAWGYGYSNTPTQVPSINNVKLIHSTGTGGFLGAEKVIYSINSDSTLWAWGNKFHLLVGIHSSSTPIQDTILRKIIDVAGGAWTATLILNSSGTILGWGDNSYGLLGTGSNITHSDTVLTVLNNVLAISSKGGHIVVLKKDGSLWAWGENSFGQLGDSSNLKKWEPIQIKGVENIKKIVATEGSVSFAIQDNGSLWSWGANGFGQLGDGTSDNRNYPELINGISNVVEVTGGATHTVAVTSDGKLWTWGRNDKGQLGDGTFTNRSTPAQVNGICDIEVSVPKITLNSTEYKIYPNPTNNLLTIDFTTVTPIKIEIQDIHGRTVYSQTVSPTQNTHEVSLVDVSSGVYFVKLFSSEGVVMKKIIKN